MAIPTYQQLMLPLLKLAGDGKERSLSEAIDLLAATHGLSDEDRHEMLPSGQQLVFENRVGWARTYLKKALLVETPRRGYFRISQRGMDVLKQKPPAIDVRYLEQFDEFQQFRAIRREPGVRPVHVSPEPDAPPEEILAGAYQNLRDILAKDLLEQLKAAPPQLFEKIVVEVLVSMGYGGSRQDAGKAIGKSGDEGIDGIIKEDRLGLDIIYVQAKKWEGPVSRPEVQKFAGALQGKRARKGVLITTSRFSQEARQFAQDIEIKIALIDGEQLAEIMIDRNIGVTVASSYQIKRLDKDYFTED